MRIGILGGTFDPIHAGHVAMILSARRELRLDKVLLLPTGDPPYKKPFAGKGDRLTMALLAVRGMEGVEVCDLELFRAGPTYTVDTLRRLRGRYSGDELIYLMGADAFRKVDQWKGADEVKSLCQFACAGRVGVKIPENTPVFAEDIPDISSEALRAGIRKGRPDWKRMPAPAAEYAAARGLYLAAMSEEEILADLRKRLKPGRFAHTLGVMRTAGELARRFGADVGRARCAALLHDCAKGLDADELLSLAEPSDADDMEKRCLPVLHAPVGAYLAKVRYGVECPEVINAIRRHTVGAENMSALDAAVYVADMIEPGRRPFPGLEQARKAAMDDLFRAALVCAKRTRDYASRNGGMLHPMTEKMIAQYEKR